MRTRMSAVLGLTLALALGACDKAADGRGIATADGTAKPSASATSGVGDDYDKMLKFAQCMRQNGLPSFKDPEPGEGPRIRIGGGDDKASVDKAMKACQKLLPKGGEPMQLNAEQVEQARQMARCMRENGVPKFPDPQPNGQIKIDGNELGLNGPDDPRMQKAEELCARYRPSPPPGAGSADGRPRLDRQKAGGS